MRQKKLLKTKLLMVGCVLLCVALVSIGLTLWVTWQLEGGAAAVNEAGRMRMQTWRLASAVQADTSPSELANLVSRFDDSVALLRHGDPSRPLFVPWNESVQAQFAVVADLWTQQRSRWLGPQQMDPTQAMHAAEEFAQAIDRLVLQIEAQLSRLTAVLNLFQFGMLALAIGSAVVMLYTGHLYVIRPLDRLRQGLAQVQAGQLQTRIEVDTQDEFGQVAAGFNRMTHTLASLYQGLEAQVQAKTRHIESQHARLQALYEVSAFLAKANTMEEMSQGFSQRVRAVMKADALTVRWLDEGSQRYLMLASDCFPQELTEAERSLPMGACSCGAPPGDVHIRVIPIRDHERVGMHYCSRLGYETVVSVPIRLQLRVLGEIDLFYRSSVGLTREEKDLLDALASHLASGLEGLRAAALEREAAIGQERALLARELHDSIAQSLAFMKFQVQMLRAAATKGQAARLEQVIGEIDTGVQECMGDVRELLVHFRTRTNIDDIVPALQMTLTKFEHQTGLNTQLDVQGDGLPLPPDVQVQVLHVVQEALSNIRKHAKATEVKLQVHKGARWRFVVQDNGGGFDPDIVPGVDHVGLSIMRERAARVSGELQVASTAGGGTVVTLVLPSAPGLQASGMQNQATPQLLTT